MLAFPLCISVTLLNNLITKTCFTVMSVLLLSSASSSSSVRKNFKVGFNSQALALTGGGLVELLGTLRHNQRDLAQCLIKAEKCLLRNFKDKMLLALQTPKSYSSSNSTHFTMAN